MVSNGMSKKNDIDLFFGQLRPWVPNWLPGIHTADNCEDGSEEDTNTNQ